MRAVRAVVSPRLCIHWRARHMHDCRLAELAKVLRAHPGEHEVTMTVGKADRFRLPVSVDAEARGLLSEVSAASSGTAMAHVVGVEEPFR